MRIQGEDVTPPARADLDAEQIGRLVGWSLRLTRPRLRRRGSGQADWSEEVTAEANCAACLAMREFDPGHGVALPVFVRARIRAAVGTMNRRDRLHRRRYGRGGGKERLADVAAPPAPETFPFMAPLLDAALDRLPRAEKRLLAQVFWEGRRSGDIAAEGRGTARAVRLRTRTALLAAQLELRRLARPLPVAVKRPPAA